MLHRHALNDGLLRFGLRAGRLKHTSARHMLHHHALNDGLLRFGLLAVRLEPTRDAAKARRPPGNQRHSRPAHPPAGKTDLQNRPQAHNNDMAAHSQQRRAATPDGQRPLLTMTK
jgi:hypothetical protein